MTVRSTARQASRRRWHVEMNFETLNPEPMPWLQRLYLIWSLPHSPDSSWSVSYFEQMKPFLVSEPLLFLFPLSRMLFLQILHISRSFSSFSSQLQYYPSERLSLTSLYIPVPSFLLSSWVFATHRVGHERIARILKGYVRWCCYYLYFKDECAETRRDQVTFLRSHSQ